MHNHSRRGVIGWLVAAGLLPLVPSTLLAGHRSGRLGHRLAAVMSYPLESARAIGVAFLEAWPGERSVDGLRSRVKSAVADAVGESVPRDDAALAGLVNRRICADFESGEVAVLRGWVLSRTEARLCALVALESEA